MKKAFPVLWRYALVVMTSCALAFFISQNIAHAAEHSNAEITKPSIYGASGPFAVQTLDLAWRDGSRNRDITIRVEFPKDESGAKNAFPLILFSHALGGSRESGVMWGQHWASHGFIVVHWQRRGAVGRIETSRDNPDYEKRHVACECNSTRGRYQVGT